MNSPHLTLIRLLTPACCELSSVAFRAHWPSKPKAYEVKVCTVQASSLLFFDASPQFVFLFLPLSAYSDYSKFSSGTSFSENLDLLTSGRQNLIKSSWSLSRGVYNNTTDLCSLKQKYERNCGITYAIVFLANFWHSEILEYDLIFSRFSAILKL